MSASELIRWAQVTATANGTRHGDEDMRAWYSSFCSRVKQETGIDIRAVETQQRSKQRAAVLLSGMRAFQGMVTSLLEEQVLLRQAGLEATGNWDELKMDLNKMLTDGTSLVPAGLLPLWEVDGERCEQMTLLIGYMGYRSATHNRTGRFVSLREVRAAIKAGKLPDYGEVAGYPKLPPGFWDDEDFCVLVGLIVFKGKSGADPAWLNLVSDKSRLTVVTSESGYITTELKYQWYQMNKKLKYCPFGKRPTIPQADSHVSNESVEMSAEMELEDDAHLIAPMGHSTHFTQQLDQSGGPIQDFKSTGADLIRNMYRLRGKLSKARIAQAVQLSITLTFTPATCSWATSHVGWEEDAEGGLVYAPLSRPRMVAECEDDESPAKASSSTLVVAAAAADASSSRTPCASAALAAFRAGAMDGEPGILAGKEAALAVLGRTKGEKDGWEDEEDMEEVIEEEGSRQRRNALPNGRIVSSAEFRSTKRSQGQAALDAEAASRLKAFKVRRLNERVLAQNETAEVELASTGTIKAVKKMEAFIRARTDEPVKEKGPDALRSRVAAVAGKPLAIRLGMEPDGYKEWLAQQEQKEAANDVAAAPIAAPIAAPPAPAAAAAADTLVTPPQAGRAEIAAAVPATTAAAPAVATAPVAAVETTFAQGRPRRK
eukprot:7130532-Prymnesium_polylepis.1